MSANTGVEKVPSASGATSPKGVDAPKAKEWKSVEEKLPKKKRFSDLKSSMPRGSGFVALGEGLAGMGDVFRGAPGASEGFFSKLKEQMTRPTEMRPFEKEDYDLIDPLRREWNAFSNANRTLQEAFDSVKGIDPNVGDNAQDRTLVTSLKRMLSERVMGDTAEMDAAQGVIDQASGKIKQIFSNETETLEPLMRERLRNEIIRLYQVQKASMQADRGNKILQARTLTGDKYDPKKIDVLFPSFFQDSEIPAFSPARSPDKKNSGTPSKPIKGYLLKNKTTGASGSITVEKWKAMSDAEKEKWTATPQY